MALALRAVHDAVAQCPIDALEGVQFVMFGCPASGTPPNERTEHMVDFLALVLDPYHVSIARTRSAQRKLVHGVEAS